MKRGRNYDFDKGVMTHGIRWDGAEIGKLSSGKLWRDWWIYGDRVQGDVETWMEEQGLTDADFGTEAFSIAFKLRWL